MKPTPPNHHRRLIPMAALLLGAALSAFGEAPETMPFSQVQAGMTGEGRTVFSGTRIETFQVEILGKLPNVGPGQNLILGRCTGGPLAETGIMAGMSGSPVFVDGKLIGAVAYSWGFAKDSIAGITPIEEMLLVSSKSMQASAATHRLESLPGEAIARMAEPQAMNDWIRSSWKQVFLPPGGIGSPSIPLGVSGIRADLLSGLFADSPLRWLPVQSGSGSSRGANAAPASPPLQPGSAVGVKLVRGDVEMAATGTVTWVDGSKVLGFGHPLFGLGPVDLPMTGASVVALMPSLNQSAKFAVPLAELGALRQDRSAGIAGQTGANATMIPVRLKLKGPSSGDAEFSFDLAANPQLSAVLLYSSVTGILGSRERTSGSATVRLLEGSVIKLADGVDISLDNLYSGPNGIQLGTVLPAYILQLLQNNPWAAPRVSGINLLMEYEEAPRTARVSRVSVSRYRVRPGETVDVDVVLKPFGGPDQIVRRTLAIPESTAPGPLTLVVGGAEAARRSEGRGRGIQPQDLNQLIQALNQLRRNDRVYFVATQQDDGALLGTDRLTNLPPSATTVLTRPRSRGNLRILPRRGVVDASAQTLYSVEGSASLLLEVVPE